MTRKFVYSPWLLASLAYGAAAPFALARYLLSPGLGLAVGVACALLPLGLEGAFVLAAVRHRKAHPGQPSSLAMVAMIVAIWCLTTGIGYAVKAAFHLHIPPAL